MVNADKLQMILEKLARDNHVIFTYNFLGVDYMSINYAINDTLGKTQILVILTAEIEFTWYVHMHGNYLSLGDWFLNSTVGCCFHK